MTDKRRGKKIALLAGVVVVVLLGVGGWLSQDHIRFWWLFESIGLNEQGYPEYRHRQTGIVMVRVSMRHDAVFEEGVDPESFLVARNQVTLAEWQRLLSPANPKSEPAGNNETPYVEFGPTLDTIVSDAEVRWMKEQMLYDLTGLSLPSKSEWRYVHTQQESLGVWFTGVTIFEWGRDGVCNNVTRVSDVDASPPVHLRPIYRPLP